MVQNYKNDEEALFARESLFRRKLNQLRNTGEAERITLGNQYSGFKAIEQNYYLNNAVESFQHIDPRQLESLALLDTHTELFNHDTLCRVLKDELRRAHRYKHSLSLLAITIDNLPNLTNKIETASFESLTKELAQFLMKTVRDVDIPGRFDIDRFIVICPETNLDGAISLAGRLCSKIENHCFSAAGQQSQETVSIGLAVYPDLADSYDKLLTLAMESLKAAKHWGGNTFKILT